MPTKTASDPGRTGSDTGAIRYLTLADIQTVQDTQYQDVPVPEWGGVVRLASLTGGERQRLAKSMRSDAKALGEDGALAQFAFRVVVASMVDDQDRHVHLDEQDAAMATLMTKSMSVVQRLFDASRRLSGLGQDELDDRVQDLPKPLSNGSSTD